MHRLMEEVLQIKMVCLPQASGACPATPTVKKHLVFLHSSVIDFDSNAVEISLSTSSQPRIFEIPAAVAPRYSVLQHVAA